MSDFLLDKESASESSQKIQMTDNNEKNYYSSSEKENIFEFDIIADKLKHIYSKSKLRKNLASILSTFYSYPILIIILSFLLGFLFFGLSMLFIYFKILDNLMKPIIFIILFTLFFSVIIIIIRVIDDLKNKEKLGAKWERKNILKNIGLSLTLIILLVAAFFFHAFFDILLTYKNNNDIMLYYHENYDDIKSFKYDFFLKYIINCFTFEKKRIINLDIMVQNYFGENILEKIHWKLMISCIPLLIFCFNKLIKIFLIQVKYTIPQFIIYINYFFFTILIFVVHKFYNKKDFDWFIISLIEIILISFIYIGFTFLVINRVYKLNKNPKDKNFSINKFDLWIILLICSFDLINLVGSSFIYMSVLMSFINYVYNDESFKDLKNTLMSLKIGFLLHIISNSFYYGHYLLSIIFRPIALQYSPANLKNFYIRAKKNLSSFISFKFGFK